MNNIQQRMMARASIKYENPTMVNESAAELKIENDRLKTTIMILTQKLKVKDDDGAADADKLRS